MRRSAVLLESGRGAGRLRIAGLILAAIGLYGVMSYLVAQRTREMGIRMAHGARRLDVLGIVMRRGMGVALSGMLLGMAIALAVTRFVSAFLYGIRPSDPLTFGAVFLLLGRGRAVACWIPARRAASVDPVTALRYE